MGLWGVARANTAVGVSPETFLLLLLQEETSATTGREQQGKQKDFAAVGLIVVAISCPDQWDFWDGLGQTPRLVQVRTFDFAFRPVAVYIMTLTPRLV
jgi:hypothetical protein